MRKTEDGKSELNSTKFIDENSTSTRRILEIAKEESNDRNNTNYSANEVEIISPV